MKGTTEETSVGYLEQLEDLSPLPIWDGVVARAVTGEAVSLAVVELEPGAVVPEHHHPNEQLGLVLAGTLNWRVGEETRALGPGGTWRLPRDLPHEAWAGDEGAIVVDVFAPVRGDWGELEPEPARPPRWP